ncbi:MAG: FAD-binding oxidoreductase [Proteobacteria bacterium]|nr:FAD-binding oxidoreductase [Pseudomonadota bacterium]
MSSTSPATTSCDVAVVGGGLAGALATQRLRDGGADVVLIDAPDGPAAATSRSLGIVATGGMDTPARLTHGLGVKRSRQLWTWSADAVAQLPGVERTGSIRAALDDREWDEWTHSADLIESWTGERPEAVEPPGEGFSGALRIPGDGVVDVAKLRASLPTVDRAVRARVSDPSAGGVTLALGDGSELQAEVLIIAAGPGSGWVHPWFLPMLYPVRVQGLRTDPLERRWTAPGLVRHRSENWLQEADGRVSFVGSRWAEQPEMEAGVSDDSVTSDKVHAAQVEFLANHLGIDASTAESWTGICAFSCDGLPLVGPLPGNPRIVALAGWGGWGLSMIARAVSDTCDAILGRPDPGLTPAFLTPRRMA